MTCKASPVLLIALVLSSTHCLSVAGLDGYNNVPDHPFVDAAIDVVTETHADLSVDVPSETHVDSGIDTPADSNQPEVIDEPDATTDSTPDSTQPDTLADSAKDSADASCLTNYKLCSGNCVSKLNPTTGCDLSGCAPCPSSPNGTAACISGGGGCYLQCNADSKLCTISGAKRCEKRNDPLFGCGDTLCTPCPTDVNGTAGCTAVGDGGISSCTLTCKTGFKKCGGVCVAISDPNYGCQAGSCSKNEGGCPSTTGTLVCNGTTCQIGSCGSGTKLCNGACVPLTNPQTGCNSAACTPCVTQGGTPVCYPANGACGCQPLTQAVACNGRNCGSVPDGCGGSIICGTCSGTPPLTCIEGECMRGAECSRTPCTANTYFCGSSDDVCLCNSLGTGAAIHEDCPTTYPCGKTGGTYCCGAPSCI